MKKYTIAFVKEDESGLRMLDREYFMQLLHDFGANTKLKITAEHYFPQRSLKQNGLVHWYCTALAEECGMQMEDFKMMMKMKFLTRTATNSKGEAIIDVTDGEVMTYIPSTSDLDTKEMGEFVDNIRLWGIEVLNYELPLPDANHKIHFIEQKRRESKQD